MEPFVSMHPPKAGAFQTKYSILAKEHCNMDPTSLVNRGLPIFPLGDIILYNPPLASYPT